MTATQSIDAIWVKRACQRIKTAGLQPEQLLRQVGIKPHTVNRSEARIPFRQHAEFLHVASLATKDDLFGLELAASEKDPRDAGLLAYLTLSSQTLGEALAVVERYMNLFNEAVKIRVVPSSNGVMFEHKYSDIKSIGLQQAVEFSTAKFVGSCRYITGTELRPVMVTFAHPRVRGIRKFEDFFRCPVRFRSEANSIILKRKDLSLPLKEADRRLHRILKGYGDAVLKQRRRTSPSLRLQVEAIIQRLIYGHEAEIKAVANELGMSVRTLTRRLNALGMSFAQILDEFRRDLAFQYLRDTKHGLKEIADHLGYYDLSAFSHAFKRWTGSTPGLWRARI
jgi:AraC-like DNA-binding protein